MKNVREQINADRENDELLRYLRYARNSEVHDAVLKWTPSMRHLEFKVFDAAKRNQVTMGNPHPIQLFCFLYDVNDQKELIGAVKKNPVPDKLRCAKAGVSVILS